MLLGCEKSAVHHEFGRSLSPAGLCGGKTQTQDLANAENVAVLVLFFKTATNRPLPRIFP
jgi:hypothetical protein